MTLNYEPLKIRVDKLNAQEETVTFNGLSFIVRFTYSTAYTKDNWILDVFDAEGNNLLVGKRITSTTNLTHHSIDLTETLGGWLFCVNTRGLRTSINQDNFGTEENFQIWYVSQEDADNVTV